MKKPILLTIILATLFAPEPVYAREASLLITSHEIRVSQQLYGEGEEQRTFCYSINEEMEIKNLEDQIYKGPLPVWTGVADDDEDEIRITASLNGSGDKSLEFSIEEGVLQIKLDEETYIPPQKKLQLNLEYRVYFVYQEQKEEWSKKILHPHTPNSLELWLNWVESAGFWPRVPNIPIARSKKEEGWFTSGRLSPQVGDIFPVTSTREKPKPLPEEEGVEIQKTQKEEPAPAPKGKPSNIASKLEGLLSKHLIPVLVALILGNASLLGLVLLLFYRR